MAQNGVQDIADEVESQLTALVANLQEEFAFGGEKYIKAAASRFEDAEDIADEIISAKEEVVATLAEALERLAEECRAMFNMEPLDDETQTLLGQVEKFKSDIVKGQDGG